MNRDKAAVLLRRAADLVAGPRGQTHGEQQLMLAAELWSQYLGGLTITERDVAMMMALVKISRAKAGDSGHEDHYVDGAAYVAMAGAMEEADAIWHARPEERVILKWPVEGLDPRAPECEHFWVYKEPGKHHCPKCNSWSVSST